MFKKIVLGSLAVLIVAGATLFVMNGKDNYDASQYSASVTDGLNVGSKISFTLPDQFDKSHTLDNDAKVLILAFSKDTGHMVKEFLATQDTGYLKNKAGYFIADIHKMPVIIRNTFALPGLQKSSYAVLLIYDQKMSEKINFIDNTDKAAVVSLENGTIQAVKYVSTPQELQASL